MLQNVSWPQCISKKALQSYMTMILRMAIMRLRSSRNFEKFVKTTLVSNGATSGHYCCSQTEKCFDCRHWGMAKETLDSLTLEEFVPFFKLCSLQLDMSNDSAVEFVLCSNFLGKSIEIDLIPNSWKRCQVTPVCIPLPCMWSLTTSNFLIEVLMSERTPKLSLIWCGTTTRLLSCMHVPGLHIV